MSKLTLENGIALGIMEGPDSPQDVERLIMMIDSISRINGGSHTREAKQITAMLRGIDELPYDRQKKVYARARDFLVKIASRLLQTTHKLD